MGVVSSVTGGIPPERMIAGRDDMIVMATMAPTGMYGKYSV